MGGIVTFCNRKCLILSVFKYLGKTSIVNMAVDKIRCAERDKTTSSELKSGL